MKLFVLSFSFAITTSVLWMFFATTEVWRI
jgi:hypothetical protein